MRTEKDRERWRRWMYRHRDQNADKARRWRLLHLDQSRGAALEWAKTHPEQLKANLKRWAQQNPRHKQELNRQYRLRRRGADGSHTHQEWLAKIELHAGCCFYCGGRLPLFRDHVVPLSRGGSDSISNIVPSCKSCNSKKGTRTLAEFLSR